MQETKRYAIITYGSTPLAFDTMALSTIEMAGATESAHAMAAVASIAMRTGKGDRSGPYIVSPPIVDYY